MKKEKKEKTLRLVCAPAKEVHQNALPRKHHRHDTNKGAAAEMLVLISTPRHRMMTTASRALETAAADNDPDSAHHVQLFTNHNVR
jgi:hypothetical protein